MALALRCREGREEGEETAKNEHIFAKFVLRILIERSLFMFIKNSKATSNVASWRTVSPTPIAMPATKTSFSDFLAKAEAFVHLVQQEIWQGQLHTCERTLFPKFLFDDGSLAFPKGFVTIFKQMKFFRKFCAL